MREMGNSDVMSGATRLVVLVGLPGAGKTTTGQRLADRLVLPFVDLDVEIERQAGRSVTEIFATAGELAFRDAETEVTRGLLVRPPSIVAAGGGWVERSINRELVRPVARVVHLAVSPATAHARLSGEWRSRPLLAASDPGAVLESLAARRAPLYATSDVVLDTEVLSTEQVVNALMELALRWGVGIG